MADLLFEIGTEELPAAYLPSLIEQLGRQAAALFQTHHLPYQALHSYGTPRRLVLVVERLAAIQRKPGEDIRGPSKQAAYDSQGKPTPALLGFLKSRGGTLSQTRFVSSEKGEYVYLAKPSTQTPTAKVLPMLLVQLVSSLRSPKTMRWDASGVRFARPIRWLLATYGSRAISISIGALRSRQVTWVGGPKMPRAVRIASPQEYFDAVRKAAIILDQQERRQTIQRQIDQAGKAGAGRVPPELIQYGLLEEVTYLLERPFAITGRFEATYLELPREVLVASMAKHQRVFALEAANTLRPQFVAILEGPPSKPAAVRAVIERILNARLADSAMFWKQDLGRSIQHMNRDLEGVSFHEKLGTMRQKTARLSQLSHVLGRLWKLAPGELKTLEQACELAKADLVSTMVKEFPTLQGIMGKHYARAAGIAQDAADAIAEQYLPIGHYYPKTLLGSALAILDKYDTLAGYFSVGIEPTGDQDPFGLRRAAQGIVEIGWRVHRPLSLGALFTTWQSLAPFVQGKATVADRIKQYVSERLYTFAWPAPAPSTDVIDAVLASPCDDLIDAMDRIVSLQQLSGNAGLLRAAKVIERTRNILKGSPLRQPTVDPARLQEPIEQRLWNVYQSHHEEVAGLAAARSYGKATTRFAELFFEPLHEFFEHVLVNVPEPALQQNRLALLHAIQMLYTERIADLSKLTVLQPKERLTLKECS